MTEPAAPGVRDRFVGEVVEAGGALAVRDPYAGAVPVALARPFADALTPGDVVLVAVRDGLATPAGPALATAGSARAELYRIAAEAGLDPVFSDAVEREVAAILAAPGIDDASLVDLTALPFVTVDGPTTRDLDQALYLAREGAGFVVYYALADAAHYVRPGSALFAEALRRGASYYLPGIAVPMLPPALSEGVISLNAGGARRALTFVMHVDALGACPRIEVIRARIHSRARLTFADAQALVDAPAASPLAGADFAPSLLLLPEVGGLRQRQAEARGVVRYRRATVEVALDGEEGLEFIEVQSVTGAVERWNEQLSLLCNREGARWLRDHPAPYVQPVYRVHPAPAPEKLGGLEAMIARLVEVHGLDPGRWRWTVGSGAPLGEYLDALPATGPEGRIARAIHRHAVLTNLRSSYATEPGPHHGVGAEAYARFSAPMRELVGLFVHKEAIELLTGVSPHTAAEDVALRDQVVVAANRARQVQRRIEDLANQQVLDRLFARDLARPWDERPDRAGTVMGVAGAKVYVQLDAPEIDVKLYLRDLEAALGARLAPGTDGVALRAAATGAPVVRVGDAVALRVERHDAERDRWVLRPVATLSPGRAPSR